MLIRCPECGREVSNRAKNCINCGYPLNKVGTNQISCPYCGGHNVNISVTTVGEEYQGRNEVRKKSAVTRAGNKAGRAGMVFMTGGLWALTPKKSKYNEVKKGKTKYTNVKIAVCQSCGSSWEI